MTSARQMPIITFERAVADQVGADQIEACADWNDREAGLAARRTGSADIFFEPAIGRYQRQARELRVLAGRLRVEESRAVLPSSGARS